MLCLAAALALAAPPAPTVTLDAPGSAPLAPLVITPTVGTVEEATLTLTLTARSQGAEGIPVGELPTLTLGLAVEPLHVADTIRYQVAVREASAADTGNADLDPALDAALAPLTEVTGQLEVTPTGRALHADWSAPPTVDPSLVEELRKAVTFALPTLPDEPVGIGASWTVRRPLADQGFAVTQVETWTLVARSATGTTLRASLQQEAELGQAVEGLGEGLQATLKRHLAIGDAAYELDAGRLMPREALEGMTVKYKVAVAKEDQTTVLSTIVGHELALRRSDAPPPSGSR